MWLEMFADKHQQPGVDDEGVFWAETPEELEEMARRWEQEGWEPA